MVDLCFDLVWCHWCRLLVEKYNLVPRRPIPIVLRGFSSGLTVPPSVQSLSFDSLAFIIDYFDLAEFPGLHTDGFRFSGADYGRLTIMDAGFQQKKNRLDSLSSGLAYVSFCFQSLLNL